MPYLYCRKHGQEREAGIVNQQEEYRHADEIVLVVSGKLISGSWACDSCNDEIRKGGRATLVSSFPSHCRDGLYSYDFAYERQYFRMTLADTATAYGAEWPDNSIRNRRTFSGPPRPAKQQVCALDLFTAKD